MFSGLLRALYQLTFDFPTEYWKITGLQLNFLLNLFLNIAFSLFSVCRSVNQRLSTTLRLKKEGYKKTVTYNRITVIPTPFEQQII